MARVDGTSCRLIASLLRCQAQSEYCCPKVIFLDVLSVLSTLHRLGEGPII